MRSMLPVVTLVLCGVMAPTPVSAQEDFSIEVLETIPVDDLVARAEARRDGTSRIPLASPTAQVLQNVESLEPEGSNRVPNYVRVLATVPRAIQPFATMLKTVLYAGSVEPEVKMAMGVRVAQFNGSPYVAVHLRRFLQATDKGQTLWAALAAGELDRLRHADRLALRYADLLTGDIHGVVDEDFETIRGPFNDGQVSELTMTVGFFNYFTRMAEAVELPLETWVLDTAFVPPTGTFEVPAARVNLISDGQVSWAARTAARRRTGAEIPTAFNIVNSIRAMMLSSEIGSAWSRYYGVMSNGGTIGRELQLQVSFAVSMANGCRYCTMHQVQALRGAGVSMDKLMAMKKDDSALTPRERAAVSFTRALTRNPAALTEADYETLAAEFGDEEALEVILQTCNFAFMNRFTDGLRLPTEDAAVQVYREVYGADFQPQH